MGMFSFKGRTDGTGFFMASLSMFAALIVWTIVGMILAAIIGESENSPAGMVTGVGFVATLPFALWVFLAGMARRLHDIGASAWWLLLCLPLLPLAGLILLVAPSQREENRFGT